MYNMNRQEWRSLREGASESRKGRRKICFETFPVPFCAVDDLTFKKNDIKYFYNIPNYQHAADRQPNISFSIA